MSKEFDQNEIFNGNQYRDKIISVLNRYGFQFSVPEPDAGVDIVSTKKTKDATYKTP